jgi:hypothetical protein
MPIDFKKSGVLAWNRHVVPPPVSVGDFGIGWPSYLMSDSDPLPPSGMLLFRPAL